MTCLCQGASKKNSSNSKGSLNFYSLFGYARYSATMVLSQTVQRYTGDDASIIGRIRSSKRSS